MRTEQQRDLYNKIYNEIKEEFELYHKKPGKVFKCGAWRNSCGTEFIYRRYKIGDKFRMKLQHVVDKCSYKEYTDFIDYDQSPEVRELVQRIDLLTQEEVDLKYIRIEYV